MLVALAYAVTTGRGYRLNTSGAAPRGAAPEL